MSYRGTALRCRECGREYPIAPIYTCEWCFGPLEATYDYDAIRGVAHPGVDRGRTGIDLALRAPAPGRGPGGQRPRRRVDAAGPGRAPRGRARPRRAVAQGRHPQPHELVQGPGRGGGAGQGARVRLQDRRVRVHRQPRQRGGRRPRRAPGSPASCSSRPTSRPGRSSPPRSTAATSSPIDGNYDDVNRLCAELAAEYPWAFVNVNVRPFYAEGSKTLAYETAEQLGWQTPDHVVVPIASGSLLTKIHKGFEELHKVGLLDEEPRGAGVGRAGHGLLAGRHGVRRRRRRRAPGAARTPSPSRSPSATRPTATTRST